MQQSLSSPIWLKQSMSLKLINYTLYKRLDGINNRSIIRLLFYFPILEKRLKTRKMYTFHFMHILHKILWKLCVGTCLLEPNVATPLLVTRDPGFYDHVRIQRHIYLPCEVQSQLTRNLANPFQLNNGLHVFKLLKNILKIDKSYFKL